MNKLLFLPRYLMAAFLSVGLLACGGGDEDKAIPIASAPPEPSPAPDPAPGPAPSPDPAPAPAPAPSTGFAISSATLSGSNLTVTGSGFGTRARATPLHFEDFDARAVGAEPASFGYVNYGGFGGKTAVDASNAFSGARSLRHQTNFDPQATEVQESFPHIALNGFSANELYVSYRMRFATHGSRIGQLKFNRSAMEDPAGYGSPCYGGKPKFRSSYYQDTVTTSLVNLQGGIEGDFGINEGWVGETYAGTPAAIPENTWVQVEEYYHLNDIGQANGEMVTYVNGHRNFNLHDLRSRSSASQRLSCAYLVIGIDYFITPGSTNGVAVWYDDHYVDTTRARVVLANAAVWEQATQRSPQPSVQWEATRITAQLKRAGFAAGSDAWLYVVRADGSVSAGSKIRLP